MNRSIQITKKLIAMFEGFNTGEYAIPSDILNRYTLPYNFYGYLIWNVQELIPRWLEIVSNNNLRSKNPDWSQAINDLNKILIDSKFASKVWFAIINIIKLTDNKLASELITISKRMTKSPSYYVQNILSSIPSKTVTNLKLMSLVILNKIYQLIKSRDLIL